MPAEPQTPLPFIRVGRFLAVVAVCALIVAACGGGSDGEVTGVASLEDIAGAAEPADDAPAGDAELEADEVALEFSQCMRDQDLDFPDVGVNAEGNPDLRSSFQASDLTPGSDEFRSAMEVCGEILQGAGFGGGRAALADDPAIQDAFVEYSECLRDQGLDVGDIQLGGGGAPGASAGQAGAGEDGAPQRGQGQGQGGFGNRADRIANQLGIDPEDPVIAEALDVCGPILDEALAGFGPGAAPTN